MAQTPMGTDAQFILRDDTNTLYLLFYDGHDEEINVNPTVDWDLLQAPTEHLRIIASSSSTPPGATDAEHGYTPDQIAQARRDFIWMAGCLASFHQKRILAPNGLNQEGGYDA